ncbi:MAG: hypothetical protein U1E65_26635 [Myxococcota bacterium]
MLRAFRVPSGHLIAPFGEPARTLDVATQTVGAWQEEALKAAGFTLVDIPSIEAFEAPGILFFDDVFVTPLSMRFFAIECLRATEDLALALPASAAEHALALLGGAIPTEGGHRFDLFFLREKPQATTREGLRAATRPKLLPHRERKLKLRLPRAGVDGGAAEGSLTSEFACHVRHWIHLHRLSQLAIGGLLLGALRQHPFRAFRALRAARRSPFLALRKMVFIDPTATVHPTADIEGSIIGPGCIVRAHAHVHTSVLGRDVDVGDHAAIVGCTLADRVQVLRASYFAHCASMSGSTLANNKAQLSLFGRDVFLTTSVLLLDAKFEGEIKVEHEGGLASIGGKYLGACLGHRTKLGANVALAPGRALPNDVVLVGEPGLIAGVMPEAASAGAMTIRGGKVVPI